MSAELLEAFHRPPPEFGMLDTADLRARERVMKKLDPEASAGETTVHRAAGCS